jgi:hypothetical protein
VTEQRRSNAQPIVVVRQAGGDDIALLAQHRAAMFRDKGQLAPHQEEPLQRATAAYLRDALDDGRRLYERLGFVPTNEMQHRR